MEHSFKRRKVSGRSGGPAGIHRLIRDRPDTSNREHSHLHNSGSTGPPYAPRRFSTSIVRSSKDLAAEGSKRSPLHPRNLIPAEVSESVKPPAKTVVASVIQVVVDNGAGSEVTQLLVPVSSKVVSVQGFAPITLGGAPAAASEAPSGAASPQNSRNHQPPATHSTEPNSYPNSYPVRTTAVTPSRTDNPSASQSTAGGASASSNPLSISVPGSESQVVLSSPPSTPLPSSAASTTPSSSTGSYFSSSASSPSTPSPLDSSKSASSVSASSTAQTSTAAQTSNAHNIPATPISNVTSSITCKFRLFPFHSIH